MTPHEKGLARMGEALQHGADDLAAAGLVMAELGGGALVFSEKRVKARGRTAMVALVCGAIPDDLRTAFINFCRGFAQDIETHGGTTVVVKFASKDPPA